MIALQMTVLDANYWDAVTARDRAMDGVFYYAVMSTGVYCRPSCPSGVRAVKTWCFFAPAKRPSARDSVPASAASRIARRPRS